VRSLVAAAAVAIAGLLVPGAAPAATVANGGFETGNLSGWQVANSSEAGNWFTYSGTSTPFQKAEEEEKGESVFPPFFAPPEGTHAAVTDESSPDTAILYQDIALEPYYSHQLTMTLYYRAFADIKVPSPDTLKTGPEGPPSEEGSSNEQVRVDVIKPGAPIESLDPSDILATLFANKTGDPQALAPTVLSADLTPFAGQTVRLRIANAANDFIFNAAVDSVSVVSTPPSNVFERGKLKLNRANGTGTLRVTVPGAGVLKGVEAAAAKATSSKKGGKRLVRPVTLKPTAAGTVKVPLRPTRAGRKILKKRGKLRVRVRLTYTPTGGIPSSQTFRGTLKLKLKKKRKQKRR
jgi:hypothetical protein